MFLGVVVSAILSKRLEERTFFPISLAYLVHDFFTSLIIIAFAFDHCIQAQWWRRAKKSQIGLKTQILGGGENYRQLVAPRL